MNDDVFIKKNILDLHFQKNLVIMSTLVIIIFTYFIAVAIAYMTGQIKLDDPFTVILIFVFTIAFLGVGSAFFFNSYFHIRNIPRVLKSLDRIELGQQ